MDTLSLKGIAAAGGSIVISAANYDVLSLKNIAASGKNHNVQLIIKDANKLDALSCKNIASSHPGYVTFDFT